jgi:hypothetical protein
MTGMDRIKRALAFFLSAALFIVLLPITLSYSLGYKIDYRELKAYKTGILHVRTNPAGASLYLNGVLHDEATPAQIEELKPGKYLVDIRRDGFYPWEKELVVRPNMVTRADGIILFPVKQEMTKLINKDVADIFVTDRSEIYYFSRYGLFKSDIDGGSMKRVTTYCDWPEKIKSKKMSPDGAKLIIYDDRKVWIVFLRDPERSALRSGDSARVDEIMSVSDAVNDVFWHSSSSYIIVVTPSQIAIAEARAAAKNIVSLYKFNSPGPGIFYENDCLYFTDTKLGQEAASSARYPYRIDLKRNFFEGIMKRLLKKDGDAASEQG